MSDTATHVVPQDLFVASAAVDVDAEDLRKACVVAINCIESDLPFLPGLASAALANKTAEWQATTDDIVERLAAHALALRTGGTCYVDTNDSTAHSIAAAALHGSPTILL